MPTYTVQSAASTPKPDKGYGPMQSIALVLQEYGQSETTAAEWYTKQTTSVPQPGSTIDGEIKPGQYGPTFKRAQQGGFGGRGGGGRSPEESRRIVRQHSQSRALQYVEFAHLRGTLPDDFKLHDLSPIIDFFHRDAMEGGQ